MYICGDRSSSEIEADFLSPVTSVGVKEIGFELKKELCFPRFRYKWYWVFDVAPAHALFFFTETEDAMEEGDSMVLWFELINKKNDLVRKEAELMYRYSKIL